MTSVTMSARSVRARWAVRLDVLRVLLTLLALVPYMLGWLAGTVVTAAAWTWTAVLVGWRDARRSGDG